MTGVWSDLFSLRMIRPDQSSLVARKIGDVRLGALRKPADLLHHELIGSDADTSILQGFSAMGSP